MRVATGQHKLFATNSTNDSQTLTAGRLASLPTSGVYMLGSDKAGRAERMTGVQLSFVGTDAANETVDFHIWAIHRGNPATDLKDNPADYERRYLGKIAATLGTAQGAASGTPVTDSDYIADILTWTLGTTSTTPKGIGETYEGAYGAPASRVYSPADNTPAVFILTELGGAVAIQVEPVVGTAASANCLAEGLSGA